MKRNIIKLTLIGMITAFTFSACDDWLDVSPKSQIEEDDKFSREGGYKDQLTGVYTKMSSEDMYGLQMGIGFTEVLSQNYDININGPWRYAAEYDYTQTDTKKIIDNIWLNTYNCITNLNLLLKHINEADPNMFTNNNYYLYKGEALGLRAFLHFDLMRLFACSPAMDKNAKGVPYVTEYSTNIVKQKTVNETMQLIINDLLEAKNCLDHDSLKISASPYQHRANRSYYFNYFANTATLARACMWMGDTENALKYANEIVDMVEGTTYTNSRPFYWISRTNLEQSQKTAIDYAFSCEHLFHLTINKWEDTSDKYFTSAGEKENATLSPTTSKVDDIFEQTSGYGNDFRRIYGYEQDGEKRYIRKFWYMEGSGYNNMYPLIRLTEAFYIAAECLKQSNPKRAIELLNEVRDNRGLSLATPLSEDLTTDQIQEEIYKEYRKEFIAESQLFYYYKRLNASEIKGAAVRPNKSIYVLPIPESDIEFGGYEN